MKQIYKVIWYNNEYFDTDGEFLGEVEADNDVDAWILAAKIYCDGSAYDDSDMLVQPKQIFHSISFPNKEAAKQYDAKLKKLGWHTMEITPTIDVEEVKKKKIQ